MACGAGGVGVRWVLVRLLLVLLVLQVLLVHLGGAGRPGGCGLVVAAGVAERRAVGGTHAPRRDAHGSLGRRRRGLRDA